MTDIPKFAFPFRRTPLVLPSKVNLVPNGRFDHDVVGQPPAGWVRTIGASGPTVENIVIFQGSAPNEGLFGILADGAWQYVSSVFAPVTPGVSYTVFCNFQQTANNSAVGWRWLILWYDENQVLISTTAGAETGNIGNGVAGDLSAVGVAPSNAAFAKVAVDQPHINTIQGRLDNINFAPTAQGTTYVDGDSTGMIWTGAVGNSISQTFVPARKIIEVEQDSIEHIDACAQMVIRCPIGFRDERPEFGWPFPEFTNIPVDTAPIEDALQHFGHPSATASASEYGDIIDQSIRYMRVVEQANVDVRRESV